MTNEQKLGYILGLIDGEGCLDIQQMRRHNKKTNKEKRYYYARITVSNKNLDCLRVVRDFFGFGRINFSTSSKVFELTFNEKETIQVLHLVGDGFIVKKREAELLRNFLEAKDEMFFVQLREYKWGYNRGYNRERKEKTG